MRQWQGMLLKMQIMNLNSFEKYIATIYVLIIYFITFAPNFKQIF